MKKNKNRSYYQNEYVFKDFNDMIRKMSRNTPFGYKIYKNDKLLRQGDFKDLKRQQSLIEQEDWTAEFDYKSRNVIIAFWGIVKKGIDYDDKLRGTKL
jgi:hypothetical protein